ncbi:PLP-dependent aminotransferase family protein [soil metagenome]
MKFKLDSDKRLPRYRRLASSIRKSIESGQLQPGDSVPSTRDLAKELKLARVTVITAYDELISQGYLKTVSGSGTFVLTPAEHAEFEELKLDVDAPPADKHLSSYAARIMKLQQLTSTSADQPVLNFGASPMDLLPLKQWRTLLQKHCSINIGKRFDTDLDPMGFRPLREALAKYLKRVRGLNCNADMIAVFASSQQTVNLILRLLVNKSEQVAMENPGFVFARKTIRSLDAEVLPISVDKDGMVVSELNNHPACKIAYVTPSHQDPTGAILSSRRRHALLDWAASNNCFIIEDDYDCEYNYGTPPLQSLQGQDQDQSVIYISTFWKILFPIMPIGFVVVPPVLIPALAKAKMLAERNFSLLEQYALTDFINEGYLDRHISKTRKLYAERRRVLISALTRAFGQAIKIPKYSSGMHITIHLETKLSDKEILARAALADLPLVSTEEYYIAGHSRGEFLVSFAGRSTDGISARVNKFAKSLQ